MKENNSQTSLQRIFRGEWMSLRSLSSARDMAQKVAGPTVMALAEADLGCMRQTNAHGRS